MDIAEEFRALIRALNAARIPYAVCGGFAVIVHGFPRVTQDIDLLVRDEDLSRVRETARRVGFALDSGSFTINRGRPGESRFHRMLKIEGAEHLMLDLLAVTPDREAIFAAREAQMADDLPLTVIGREGLRRMKLAAARPKDLEDLRKLSLLSPEDEGRTTTQPGN